jgi:hypothetical protein
VRAHNDSPDGQAAVILLGLGAPEYTYPWEVVCFREPDGSWMPSGGLNAPGWTATHDDEAGNPVGVLTVWGDAPVGAGMAIVTHRATDHTVIVRDGFYFFASWDEPPPPEPPDDPLAAPWGVRFGY